jgi:hypothetical protein
MKIQHIVFMAAGLVFAGCASPHYQQVRIQQASQAWEYKRIYIEQTQFESQLNRLGEQGWEVVDHRDEGGSAIIFLKRPKP